LESGALIRRFAQTAVMPAPALTGLEVFAEVIGANHGDLSVAVARSCLSWTFGDRAVSRMSELARLNCSGTITPAEHEELDKYLRVGAFSNLLQAKARLSLKSPGK
jgi:hypothetical protein